MSIKLKTQESIEKKLASLIQQGRELSKQLLVEEYQEAYAAELGDYSFDPLEPPHYNDLRWSIIRWQKQCSHLLGKMPLGTVYYPTLELLLVASDRRSETGQKIYLEGIEVQEITTSLEAILEDLKDGMFENLFLAIEVQSVLNHIEQAKELFDEEQYILAGLIILCSLESLLTEICREHLGDDSTMPRGLEGKSNFLKSKGVISKGTIKTIKELTDTRDFLAHGDSKSVSKDQVRAVMFQVESIVSHLLD